MFTINIAKAFKKKSAAPKQTRVSRLCLGTTVIEDGEFKIKISLLNDPDFPDYITIPFTEESLSLKGKVKVFEHNKDKYGHYVAHIRDADWARLHPGLPSQYTAVVEDEVCSGHVIRKDGKLQFDMKNIHGVGQYLYDLPIGLNSDKPLFSKTNEHNTSKSS